MRPAIQDLVTYDAATGDLTWIACRPADQFKNSQAASAWNTKYGGRPAGTLRKHPNGKVYRYLHLDGRIYLAHRVAFLIMTGRYPDMIDHENGNGSDNRWSNLREVPGSHVNNKNSRRRTDNASGVTGVIWYKRTKQWRARITIDGKHKSLGYFDDKQAAIDARLKAEKEHGYHQNHGSERPL